MHCWLRLKVELCDPTQVFHSEKALCDNTRKHCCPLWCFIAGLCGCMHDIHCRNVRKECLTCPSSLINWNLKWIAACIWQTDQNSVCVESTLHRPSLLNIYWECELTTDWYFYCCICHACHAVVFLSMAWTCSKWLSSVGVSGALLWGLTCILLDHEVQIYILYVRHGNDSVWWQMSS